MRREESVTRAVPVLLRTYRHRGKTASDRGTPYEVLIATILSARTKDETTIRVADALFRAYPSMRALAGADQRRVERIIAPIGFFRAKARNIIGAARLVTSQFGGRVPSALDDLLTLPGVGRKTANIVRAVVFQQPAIAVDIHVHRISNRMGWVRTGTPALTEQRLERLVPDRWKRELNDTLVKFGKDICQPRSPQCWRCPVAQWCAYPGKRLIPPGRRRAAMVQ